MCLHVVHLSFKLNLALCKNFIHNSSVYQTVPIPTCHHGVVVSNGMKEQVEEVGLMV